MKTNISLSQAAVKVAQSIRDSLRNENPHLAAWDEPGIEAAVREAHKEGNDPPDIVRALILSANDPKVLTPRGFLFAKQHWAKQAPQQTIKPPECPEHIGELEHACRVHAAAAKAVPEDYRPPPRPPGTPMPESVRAQLNARRTK